MARTYTVEQRKEALTIWAEHGLLTASEKTGIPQGTIATWTNAAGMRRKPELQGRAAAAIQATIQWNLNQAAEMWAERCAVLVTRLAATTVAALDAVDGAIASGDLRSAKDGMIAFAVAVDKAQLLTGGATGRHESEITTSVRREELLAAGRERVMVLVPPEREAPAQAALPAQRARVSSRPTVTDVEPVSFLADAVAKATVLLPPGE